MTDGSYSVHIPVSICPAQPGWREVYLDDGEPGWHAYPVAVWAVCKVEMYRGHRLVKTEGEDYEIRGFSPDASGYFDRPETCSNFWRYLGPGEPDPSFDDVLAERASRVQTVPAVVTRAEWEKGPFFTGWHIRLHPDGFTAVEINVHLRLDASSPAALGRMFRILGLLGLPVSPGQEPFWDQGWAPEQVAGAMTGARVVVNRDWRSPWWEIVATQARGAS